MNIRWLLQKDIRSVLEIQKSCLYAPQWIRKDYLDVNRSKKKSFLGVKDFPIIYVYEKEKKILGFITYKIYFANTLNSSKVSAEKFFLENPKAVKFCLENGSFFYADIISFCVHEEHRKKGIGKQLFNFIISKFFSVLDLNKEHPVSRPFMLFTKVSEKDLAVLNFLKKLSFQAYSISKNYYGVDHDAYNFSFLGVESKKETDCV